MTLSVPLPHNRTPIHLAACAGNTSVIEYLLKQPSVIVNAVDRFGGTPLDDALRHSKDGAAALLKEVGGCCTGDPVLDEVALRMNLHKQQKNKIQREPKIVHLLTNSQESHAFRNIGTKLSKAIEEQRDNVEPIVQRLIWAVKGLSRRLMAQNGRIPTADLGFNIATLHLLCEYEVDLCFPDMYMLLAYYTEETV